MQVIQEQIKSANKLEIIGNASKVTPRSDIETLSIRNYAGIVEYRPEELVITVKAGTTLKQLNQELKSNQQMLAFEPVDFGNSTIGGTVAMAMSGQASAFYGGIRDFVLGMDIINGNGEYLRFGGKVMKNVAGFDVARLLTGSAGKMATIMQISFKVLPMPQLTASYQLNVRTTEIVATINQLKSQISKHGLSAIFYQEGVLSYRISNNFAINQTARQINNKFWQNLKLPYFNHELTPIVNYKLGQLPSTTRIIDLGGKRIWLQTPKLRDTLPNQALINKIKYAFDPNNVFV